MYYMSLLEQYITELAKDVEIDDFSLKESQMKLPAIKHKWVGRLIRHKKDLFKIQSDRRTLVKSLVDKIKTSSEYAMTTPAAEKLAEKHDKVIEFDEKLREMDLVVELLEKCDKIFHSMSFDIKNLIEIIKLETL